jgi:aspartyl-tRNA(Asn)/glutamyl-tRNA(Gln) amidotransferase subunit C
MQVRFLMRPMNPHLDVQSIAGLARISITEEEALELGPQLDKVLGHIRLLESVDISSVEPTAHASPVFNVVRKDEPRDGLTHEEALANAPRKANHLVIVPKVVE